MAGAAQAGRGGARHLYDMVYDIYYIDVTQIAVIQTRTQHQLFRAEGAARPNHSLDGFVAPLPLHGHGSSR